MVQLPVGRLEVQSCDGQQSTPRDNVLNAQLAYAIQARGKFPPGEEMVSTSSPFPVVYNDGQQDRVTALLPLAPSTTWQAFQQQLMVWLGLPAGSFQVMLACSRASDREQVQKIPVHEGTNFSVLLTRHNPETDRNAHFIVQPKMGTKCHVAQGTPQRRDVHEDDVVSRASSASSSPRYSAGLMAQVAAAMAASGGRQAGSPTGATMQTYILAQQQQQRQQQAAMAQGFGTSAGGLGVSGVSSSLGGSAYGALRPGGGPTVLTAQRSAYGPPRHGPLAPNVSGWTQQGLQAQPQFHKHAAASAARQRQSGSHISYQQQAQRTGLGGYLLGGMLPPISVGVENRVPGNYAGGRTGGGGACVDPWFISSSQPSSRSVSSTAPVTPLAPCTPPATGAPARVPSFSAGALLAAQSQHGGGVEVEFWRTSPRDHVVEGFKGPSPFGPIGPSTTQG